MAEILVYGTTVLSFGAVGDGVTDDTEAFRAAFASGESLIVVPYGKGTYVIKQPLTLPSGVILECHERATIRFAGIQAAPSAQNIRIRGGRWEMTESGTDAAFRFSDAHGVTLEKVQISGSAPSLLCFDGCSDICLEELRFRADKGSAGLRFCGANDNITLRGLTAKKTAAAIEFMPSAVVSNFVGFDMHANNCARILSANGAALDNCRLDTVRGDAYEQAIDFCGCTFNKVSIRHCSLCDTYIRLADNRFLSFHMADFVRENDLEADISAHTLTISGSDAVVICDGIDLDSLIHAKKLSPKSKATFARMYSTAMEKHIYTTEITLGKHESYVFSSGGFEALEIFEPRT